MGYVGVCEEELGGTMHAEKCPVCEGKGVVPPEEVAICHGCGGKGWVEVQGDSRPVTRPYYPYYPYYPYWPAYPIMPIVTYTYHTTTASTTM
jgi:hypothetical protein